MARLGRPLKFKSPEEILEKAQAYFDEAETKKQPFTITGLALALDTSRETLMDYEDDRGEAFSDAVKKIKLVCENYAENKLYGGNPTGPIFALKNFGWKDKQEIETNTPQLDEVRENLNKLISDVKTRTPKNTRQPKDGLPISS